MAIHGYCTINEFKLTLAQALTSASPNPAYLNRPGKLQDLGKQLNLSPNIGLSTDGTPTGPNIETYALDDIYFYIRQAQSFIDSHLSSLYKTPVTPIVLKTLSLQYDIDLVYNSTLYITGYENILPGDLIVLSDGTNEEMHEVYDIDGSEVTLIDDIVYEFSSSNTRVLKVHFPNPIPYICAKLACAAFYDKWTKSQSEPTKSDFPDLLRAEAVAELNNITEGRTILTNVQRTGQRFANPNLYGDAWFKLFQTQMKDDRR